jgi:hypothetical protein
MGGEKKEARSVGTWGRGQSTVREGKGSLRRDTGVNPGGEGTSHTGVWQTSTQCRSSEIPPELLGEGDSQEASSYNLTLCDGVMDSVFPTVLDPSVQYKDTRKRAPYSF